MKKTYYFPLQHWPYLPSVFMQKKADDVAKFKSEQIDMGKIQTDEATAVFEITNIGSELFDQEQANPTCGCTIGINITKSLIAQVNRHH